MRPQHRLTAPLAAVLALALATPAGASLLLALDLPTLVARADRIAVVDVKSIQSAWNSRHDRISTTIDVAVVESWKGGAAQATHLQVVQPGGTVGDITMTVDGMPRFAVGERALLFLHGPADKSSVVGMTQGKRAVGREAGTGRWIVNVPDRTGADFVRTTPASADAPVFEMRARGLDDLRGQVRDLVNASPGGSAGGSAGGSTGGRK
ncbi:MAG TPA: hypothetical protein VHG72_08035 [Polyangia bacterium]|nr:hypothetical protein [Polyangia bacterium]